MYEVSEKTLKDAYKPYDIVTDKLGNVGFIQETDVSNGQPEPHQISYAVVWIVGEGEKTAWYNHKELTKHCNLFIKIAECSCHPMGNNSITVEKLMSFGF